MDKNDKLRLFKKVPKLLSSEELHPNNKREFVETQLFESQKALYRLHVEIEKAKVFADEDDADANRSAENLVTQAIPTLKSLKLEIKALHTVLKSLPLAEY